MIILSQTGPKDDKKKQQIRELKVSQTVYRNFTVEVVKPIRYWKPLATLHWQKGLNFALGFLIDLPWKSFVSKTTKNHSWWPVSKTHKNLMATQ